MKKPWAFIGGSLYEAYYFGVLGPGFLNQVPTLIPNPHISKQVLC